MFAQLRLRSLSWSKFNHRNHPILKYKLLCFAAFLPSSGPQGPFVQTHQVYKPARQEICM